ncbi:MAG: NAD(+) synthase [Desulfobacterales bacterium]|nr:NAD(+) synthase [Desulfobacterales bacterium]
MFTYNTLFSEFGYVRVCVCAPELSIADVPFNVSKIQEAIYEAYQQGCSLMVFPELCLTGYSCGDLFYQTVLLKEAYAGMVKLATMTLDYPIALIIGLPLLVDGRVYNCAAFINDGKILGIVPKTYLPSRGEFYETRWFTGSQQLCVDHLMINNYRVPFGSDLLFQVSNIDHCIIGIEICEDLWAVHPPSSEMSIHGASILCNLSASNEVLGKAEYRRELVKQQSARCMAAYLYCSSNANESSTDLVYSGHMLITENGAVLAESDLFGFHTKLLYTDIDVEKLANERIKNSSFSQSMSSKSYRIIQVVLSVESPKKKHLRTVPKAPFVPQHIATRELHCKTIFSIQSTALARRLNHTKQQRVVMGLSGGLDSTLSLLVCIKAFHLLGISIQGILAVNMPGFGTSSRTKENAQKLAEFLGIEFRLIPISNAVRIHFENIGHDESIHDITFENAQARERTQILMDIGNKLNALVVGTGDMSELALGWCTYNGDHMSMYNVNAGVPKTLVKYLVSWCAEHEFSENISKVLIDICETPITPELLPISSDGSCQETEKSIGPYELHDFFLFYMLRHQFSPKKIFVLAQFAFETKYSSKEILMWMRVFYQRFFQHQFKRSVMPDGPKVGSVALSPRGDWRMPSDATGSIWLSEIDSMLSKTQT